MVFSIHKGWTFLITAIVLAGIGSAVHFGVGIGFMVAAAGFTVAAFIDAVGPSI